MYLSPNIAVGGLGGLRSLLLSGIVCCDKSNLQRLREKRDTHRLSTLQQKSARSKLPEGQHFTRSALHS